MKKFITFILLFITSLVTFGSSNVRVYYTNSITRRETPQLTVAQYKSKVQSLILEINKLGKTSAPKTKQVKNKKATNIGDMINEQLKQAQIIIDKGIPLYSQLIALNPPKSLVTSHNKLKKGTQSALDVLYMSKSLMQSLENPYAMNQYELMNNLEELSIKLNELQNNSHTMMEAIFEISAAN
ncbi:hypothetical protein [Fusobacterium sp. PH5-44]|uniref:hypothetical protein n=1 Tax=unclassified Fusobacterium TaxID=2648384 RepID=UPI003D249803